MASGQIGLLFLVEAVVFSAAALVHFGVLLAGYQHLKAGIAESVIAFALLLGFLLVWLLPNQTRGVGIGAQGFALLGTLVGALTIAIGIGPRTRLDIAYHVLLVVMLICGLLAIVRGRIA